MITVYGTLCLDRLHRVPNLPNPGGYVEISCSQTAIGGEAYNTHFSLKKWDCPRQLITNSIGDSPEADLIRKLLQEQNLAEPVEPLKNQTTPVCDIYVTPDGERTIYGVGFADLYKFSDPKDADMIKGTWFTSDENLGPMSLFFADQARIKGAKVYWMDATLESHEKPKFDPTDIWQNSTDRYGKKGDLQANLAAIESVQQVTNCLCILTDSKNGFVVCGPDQPATHYPPFRAPNQIDSTGAGDCFRAGLLYSLDHKISFADSLAFAAAAGSLACQGFGATTSIPSIQEVKKLIASQPQTLLTYRQLS
ncbi:MAG: carbohydrate kinase family protein [Fimbriimonadaceae bacterium]